MKSIITLIAILMASSTLNAGQINIANASLKIVEISISAKECLDNREGRRDGIYRSETCEVPVNLQAIPSNGVMIKNQNTGDLTIDFIKSTVSLKTNSCTTASVPEWEEYCSVEAKIRNKQELKTTLVYAVEADQQ